MCSQILGLLWRFKILSGTNLTLTSMFWVFPKTKHEEMWLSIHLPCLGTHGVRRACVLNRRCCPGYGKWPSGIRAYLRHSVPVVVPFNRPPLDEWIHPCVPANDCCWSCGVLLFQQVGPSFPPSGFSKYLELWTAEGTSELWCDSFTKLKD
jgi:hypothetical protein